MRKLILKRKLCYSPCHTKIKKKPCCDNNYQRLEQTVFDIYITCKLHVICVLQ